MKKGKNIYLSTPGLELATSRAIGKRSPHCVTYTLGFPGGKIEPYNIGTGGSSAPKHPFFQVQWLTATLIKEMVDMKYRTEKYIASKNNTEKQFQVKWRVYINNRSKVYM